MVLNHLVIAWDDMQKAPLIPPGGVIPSGGSGRLATSPPHMEVGET